MYILGLALNCSPELDLVLRKLITVLCALLIISFINLMIISIMLIKLMFINIILINCMFINIICINIMFINLRTLRLRLRQY